ncbi:YggT family protein [Caldicellulosiruptor changbaiensis]|uniref:YggT family protein n=1 Tax=Caldicellulosiruptor changbaiensis TaxID=1222016 RepID=A0A3T0D620_9FIRM|nr:YggT family protein [Caldicellulosiruptor changbaiensis]AZT90362.1 YggT family protein [Caldicellulosiruptor changbaiensis]
MIRFIFGLADKAIAFVEFCIVIDALLSWVIVDPYNKYRRVLGMIVNPILDPIRSISQKYIRIGFIDFSPLIAIILLEIVRRLLWLFYAILI